MSDCCAPLPAPGTPSPKYRRILWAALIINAAMFAVEVAGGFHSGSRSLMADAADFLGDAGNYALSLFVLALMPVWRSRAAIVKGTAMAAYGTFVLVQVAIQLAKGTPPDPMTMGVLGTVALCANLTCAAMLYAFRDGDANMRSVWLCTRNDAIGNVAVLCAALATWRTAQGWPDLLVATGMGLLALRSAWTVLALARAELAAGKANACATRARQA